MQTRELLAKVKRIEIRTRKTVEELTAGAYHSVFKGRGIEFDEVREYIAGDDVGSIDWNVTARTRKPFVKQFVEERELTVQLLVDMSGSGDFGSGEQSKNQLAAELAAILAFSAIRNGDRVGLTLFSDIEELHLPPRKGQRHGLRMIRELVACERRHRGTDIKRALETLIQAAPRRRVVFLISDFLEPGSAAGPTYQKALAIAARKHDLIAIRVHDEHEERLPETGLLHLEDAETGDSLWVPAWSRSLRNEFTESVRREWESARHCIRRAGADLVDVRTDSDYLPALMQFFRTRQQRR